MVGDEYGVEAGILDLTCEIEDPPCPLRAIGGPHEGGEEHPEPLDVGCLSTCHFMIHLS